MWIPRVQPLAIVLVCIPLIGAGPTTRQLQWRDEIEAATKAWQGKNIGEAEAAFERALKIAEDGGQEDVLLAATLEGLGAVQEARGKFPQAAAALKRAMVLGEKLYGPDDRQVLSNILHLAMLYDEYGKAADAEPLVRRLVAFEEKRRPAGRPETVALKLSFLADVCIKLGKHEEADELGKRALALVENAPEVDAASIATMQYSLGDQYRKRGRLEDAERLLTVALAGHEKAYGPDSGQSATVQQSLGLLYAAQGKYVEAERLCNSALSTMQKVYGDVKLPGGVLADLAGVYAAQGKFEKAEPLYKRSLAILADRSKGPEHPEVASVLEQYGKMLKDAKRDVEARLILDRAKAIRDKYAR